MSLNLILCYNYYGDNMQSIKNMLLFISKSMLVISVISLVISFSVSSFINKGITSIVFYNFFNTDIFKELDIDEEKIESITRLEDSKKLINNYTNIIFENKTVVENININNDLLEFIKNNEDAIEKVIGQDISITDITEYIENEKNDTITEAYKTIVVETKEEIPTDISNVKFLFDNNFRLIMFIIATVGLIFTILLQWSSYMFLKTLGNTLIWSGLSVIILNGLGSIFINGILSRINNEYNVNFTNILFNSLIVVGIGVILLIIYVLIVKFIHKKKFETKKFIINK